MFAAPIANLRGRPDANPHAHPALARPIARRGAAADIAGAVARTPWGAARNLQPLALFPPERARARAGAVQTKLMVGAVNDPLEHEADRIADQVMRMPAPSLAPSSTPIGVSRKCAACEEEAKAVRTKPTGGRSAAGGEAPATVHAVLRAPGQPLDAGTRAFFEPRFGRDFSHIRVHADAEAARSAASVEALAYAAGAHIAFGAGQYAPNTGAGRALLAHELAHTVQQGAAEAPHAASDGVLARRVVGVNCPPNQFGAPDDPRGALETADGIAIDLANQMAAGLAADAQTVQGGIPADPSATLQAFEDHFGLPIAQGSGFLNRLTGVVRPTQEIALSEELAVVARRFAGVARLMGQGLSYNCPGNASLTLIGCSAGTCDDADAFSCPGNSLVALCQSFWSDFDDTARAQILIHESLHITLGNIGVGSILDATTRGAGRNFNIAGCYEALVADQTGADSHVDCPPVPAG
jgi:hypothetical protein